MTGRTGANLAMQAVASLGEAILLEVVGENRRGNSVDIGTRFL